jgi:hypothetical protein
VEDIVSKNCIFERKIDMADMKIDATQPDIIYMI